MSVLTSPANVISVAQSKRAERLLLPAGFITTAGNAFQITAAAIMVFRAENTTLAVGWLFIVVAIPQVALALVFGRLVDRFDRRMLSVLADVVSAVTALALPVWLVLGGPITLGSDLANFVLACTAALFMPANNALVKERIRDDRIGLYASRIEMANNAGMLLASSSAGFLIVAFGPKPLLVFNSLTFVASAVLTYAVGKLSTQAKAVTEAAPVESADGTTPPRAHRPIRRLALLYTAGNANLMVSNVLLTVVILHTFHQSPWVVGVTDALAGSGFIIGAACHGWVTKYVRGLRLAMLGQIGCMTFVIFEPVHYIVLMAVIPFAAFCFANGRIAARTLLTRAATVERAGRVFGGAQAFGLALGTVATVGLSLLADATAVKWAFWGLVLMVDAIALVTYLSLLRPMVAVEREWAEDAAAVKAAEEATVIEAPAVVGVSLEPEPATA